MPIRFLFCEKTKLEFTYIFLINKKIHIRFYNFFFPFVETYFFL